MALRGCFVLIGLVRLCSIRPGFASKWMNRCQAHRKRFQSETLSVPSGGLVQVEPLVSLKRATPDNLNLLHSWQGPAAQEAVGAPFGSGARGGF